MCRLTAFPCSCAARDPPSADFEDSGASESAHIRQHSPPTRRAEQQVGHSLRTLNARKLPSACGCCKRGDASTSVRPSFGGGGSHAMPHNNQKVLINLRSYKPPSPDHQANCSILPPSTPSELLHSSLAPKQHYSSPSPWLLSRRSHPPCAPLHPLRCLSRRPRFDRAQRALTSPPAPCP